MLNARSPEYKLCILASSSDGESPGFIRFSMPLMYASMDALTLNILSFRVLKVSGRLTLELRGFISWLMKISELGCRVGGVIILLTYSLLVDLQGQTNQGRHTACLCAGKFKHSCVGVAVGGIGVKDGGIGVFVAVAVNVLVNVGTGVFVKVAVLVGVNVAVLVLTSVGVLTLVGVTVNTVQFTKVLFTRFSAGIPDTETMPLFHHLLLEMISLEGKYFVPFTS